MKQAYYLGCFIVVDNLSGKAVILASLKDLYKNMCYHPITIVNPTKYVSLKYRDRYTLRVPCGQCAACQESKKREYYLRSYYHAQHYLANGGFVLFDTLTYSDKYLPHINQFVNTKYNFSCFDGSHIRKFVAILRQWCKRKYNSNFEYMLSSEYGTSEQHTHRPHYHVLFFVQGSVTPLQFSRMVADAWFYGRTDGKPYKSDYYVLNNVLAGDSARNIRILKYVTKYISKSCLFTKQINKRVNAIMFEISEYRKQHGLDKKNDWMDSLEGQMYRESLMRHIGQFHRQSTGFGASLLADLDLNQVFKDGLLRVKDNEKVVLAIPIPTYYKRKLFYEQIEVDGAKIWSPNELGVQYLEAQRKRLLDQLKLRYTAASAQLNQSIDVDSLSRYVVDERGRLKASHPESTVTQRLQDVDLYKYATRYDRHNFGKLGLVQFYLGNSTCGYFTSKMPAHVNLVSFGKRFSFIDEEKEKLLDLIDAAMLKIDKGKQDAHETRQRLVNLYHALQL